MKSSLILVAAAAIAWFAIGRLWNPQPLENVGLGLGVSVVASAINGGVAFVLFRAGRKLISITLTADGRHLLTDVWTSVGVLVEYFSCRPHGLANPEPVDRSGGGRKYSLHRYASSRQLGFMASSTPLFRLPTRL